jgi:hypothetical protein
LARAPAGIVYNEHTDEDGATVFQQARKLGFEGIVSKRLKQQSRTFDFDFLGFQFRARKTMWTAKGKRTFTHGFLPAASPKALVRIGREILGATSPQRQIPERAGCDV